MDATAEDFGKEAMDCFLDLKRLFSEPPVQTKRVYTIASFYEINEKRANSLGQ